MTLEDAVRILNREKHRNIDAWLPGCDGMWALAIVPDYWIAEFEAVAIAREYERIRGHEAVADAMRQPSPPIGD